MSKLRLFSSKLTLALMALAAISLAQGVLTVWVASRSQYHIEKGQVANKLLTEFIDLAGNKQRLKVWLAQHLLTNDSEFDFFKDDGKRGADAQRHILKIQGCARHQFGDLRRGKASKIAVGENHNCPGQCDEWQRQDFPLMANRELANSFQDGEERVQIEFSFLLAFALGGRSCRGGDVERHDFVDHVEVASWI